MSAVSSKETLLTKAFPTPPTPVGFILQYKRTENIRQRSVQSVWQTKNLQTGIIFKSPQYKNSQNKYQMPSTQILFNMISQHLRETRNCQKTKYIKKFRYPLKE